MHSTNNEGLNYPTNFLKSRGSAIRNNFLEYINKQLNSFAQRNVLIHNSLQIEQNIYSISKVPAPVVTQFIVKFKEV